MKQQRTLLTYELDILIILGLHDHARFHLGESNMEFKQKFPHQDHCYIKVEWTSSDNIDRKFAVFLN